MDVVWVMSFGFYASFLDKVQMLWIVEQQVQLINSTTALLQLNNKHWLGAFSKQLGFNYPETYITSDTEFLMNLYQQKSNETWIIKPTAGSFGDNVFKLTPNSPNARSIIYAVSSIQYGKYCIFQQYVSEIQKGEKRVIVCDDTVICYYHRSPAQKDFRTNIQQGAVASACELTEQETQLCQRIGRELFQRGAYFVGIDLVYPYVIEVNVLNPGGIGTVQQLTGVDYSDKLISTLLNKLFV